MYKYSQPSSDDQDRACKPRTCWCTSRAQLFKCVSLAFAHSLWSDGELIKESAQDVTVMWENVFYIKCKWCDGRGTHFF